MAEDSQYVYIMANPTDQRIKTANGVFRPLREGQIALLEEHEDHPFDPISRTHRVFCVTGRPPVLAFQTAAVTQRILEKQIIIVEKTRAEKLIQQAEGKKEAERAAREAPPTDDQIAEDEFDAAVRSSESKKASRAAKRAAPKATETEDDD